MMQSEQQAQHKPFPSEAEASTDPEASSSLSKIFSKKASSSSSTSDEKQFVSSDGNVPKQNAPNAPNVSSVCNVSKINANGPFSWQNVLKQEVAKQYNEDNWGSLDDESKLLLRHECKPNLASDGKSVSFMPSPHLFDSEGRPLPAPKKEEKRDDEFGGESASYSSPAARRAARRRSQRSQRSQRSRRNKYAMGYDSDESEHAPRETGLEAACGLVAGSMKCDAVEAAFFDHEVDKYQGCKVLQSRFKLHNGFVQACEVAWAKHHPLRLKPSHIWLLILQAVALHVDQHAEQLRTKWVRHDGKKKLIVDRDGFVKGLRQRNDWAGVVTEFAEQIDENTVEGSVELLEADFSDASGLDRIAAKISIMDICKNYFEYIVRTRCGFPKITLTGNMQDWINLYEKTNILLESKVDADFGKQWKSALMPVLARFIGAFEGKIDCLFWNSMIKRGARRGSGGWEWYSGWINVFFPIIKDKSNEYCVAYGPNESYIKSGVRQPGRGIDVNNYPNGLASAPVIWQYYGLEFKLKFISGFIGVTQDEESKELCPMVGWVVGETSKENEQVTKEFEKSFRQPNNKNLISDI